MDLSSLKNPKSSQEEEHVAVKMIVSAQPKRLHFWMMKAPFEQSQKQTLPILLVLKLLAEDLSFLPSHTQQQ